MSKFDDNPLTNYFGSKMGNASPAATMQRESLGGGGSKNPFADLGNFTKEYKATKPGGSMYQPPMPMGPSVAPNPGAAAGGNVLTPLPAKAPSPILTPLPAKAPTAGENEWSFGGPQGPTPAPTENVLTPETIQRPAPNFNFNPVFAAARLDDGNFGGHEPQLPIGTPNPTPDPTPNIPQYVFNPGPLSPVDPTAPNIPIPPSLPGKGPKPPENLPGKTGEKPTPTPNPTPDPTPNPDPTPQPQVPIPQAPIAPTVPTPQPQAPQATQSQDPSSTANQLDALKNAARSRAERDWMNSERAMRAKANFNHVGEGDTGAFTSAMAGARANAAAGLNQELAGLDYNAALEDAKNQLQKYGMDLNASVSREGFASNERAASIHAQASQAAASIAAQAQMYGYSRQEAMQMADLAYKRYVADQNMELGYANLDATRENNAANWSNQSQQNILAYINMILGASPDRGLIGLPYFPGNIVTGLR